MAAERELSRREALGSAAAGAAAITIGANAGAAFRNHRRRPHRINPHISYTEQAHRGYSLVEARKDELRVDFRAVADVHDPASEAFTLKRFTVAGGSPTVHPA